MDIVKNGKTKSGQPIKMTIEEFEKELDNYYLFVTKENEWSPLNKLNTNYRSNSKEFMNLVKTLYSEDEVSKIIKKGLDQKDFDNIIKDIETKITNKDQNLKMYLNNWVNDNPTDTEGFLKDILLNSKSGKDAESLAENFADSFSLNVASATEGSPYDILLNLDGIRRLSKDTPFGKTGELKTIQVKKVQSINETNTGKIYVTTFGDMRIPKQDQIDILILVDPQGKKLAIGKQIPYENPEGKVSFPEAKKNIFGKKGFYVDTTTPKLLDNSLSDDLFNKKINNKKSIQYIRKNFTLTPDQDKTLKSLGY